MKVTMTLLRGAELSNWSFIRHWIIYRNPDLLMWNELAKYLPALNAAFEKYLVLGEIADWCKLMFAPSDLKEFLYTELEVPFQVATHISTLYGNSSTSQLETSQRSAMSQEILDHAVHIVKTAGGAKTIDVMSLRRCMEIVVFPNIFQ